MTGPRGVRAGASGVPHDRCMPERPAGDDPPILITRRHSAGEPGCLLLRLEDIADPAAPPVAEALLAMRPGAPVARLLRLEVAPAARGRGLGRRLLREVVAEARAAGARVLRMAPSEPVEWLITSGFVVRDGSAEFGL